MAPMRLQSILNDSWSDADAAGLMRQMAASRTARRNSHAEPDSRAVLARTIEEEVIPRLVMARLPQRLVRATRAEERPTAGHVESLVSLILGENQARATAFVEAIGDAGVPTESLFLDLLSPTARRLGQMWEDDDCTFSDVTIGLLRLGNVMRLLSRAFAGEYEPNRAGPSALLVQMPGEQHGFGLAMVVHFFRRAGWNVRQAPGTTSAELIGLVQSSWFGIVGISVSCSDHFESLAADIRAIRKHSRNNAIGIMVGGPPFILHPQLSGLVGADATAVDGRQAVQQAQSLISLLARHR